jgi:hypothetical protein|tara:strand:+ start:24 stop:275 length:252 start_codon:yes stop_codon:yes gene_type:complete
MGKIEKYGSYVCKVGHFDIRQKIEMPRIKKTTRGDMQKVSGSVTVFVYQGKHQIAGPFKSHKLAIEEATKLVERKFKYNKHAK